MHACRRARLPARPPACADESARTHRAPLLCGGRAASLTAAAEWQEIGDRYYRRRELYELEWGLDMRSHVVASARSGGPVAAVRDDSAIVRVGGAGGGTRPEVRIWTAAGSPLAAFRWVRGRVVTLGWGTGERLVGVEDDGSVTLYDALGRPLPDATFSLGADARDGGGVVEAIVWEDGVVARTADNRLLMAEDLDAPRVTRLQDSAIEGGTPPRCMTVLQPGPDAPPGASPEVLLATDDALLVIDAVRSEERQISLSPVTRMAVAPNNAMVAAFTAEGKLVVMSADFENTLSEFGTGAPPDTPPEQMVWCGADAVVLYWDQALLLVGPFGDFMKYTYDEPAVLLPEVDGVRVFTSRSLELLQRVPDATVDVFRIGSTSPAALLHDALSHFDARSVKADDNMRAIGPEQMAAATMACAEAATHEWEQAAQRQLMRASAHGHAFTPQHEAGETAAAFQAAIRTLRVLNALRDYRVGRPITAPQLEALGADALVDALAAQGQHLLALRIAEYLSLPEAGRRVVQQWAVAKVQGNPNAPDLAILETILGKLGAMPGASFASVAEGAFRAGRQRLAAALLDHEPRAGEQVPLLTQMGEQERALDKAIESGDTDLVYLVLFHVWRKGDFKELVRVVAGRPLAAELFVSYCRATDPELLKTFYFTVGAPHAAAQAALLDALEARDGGPPGEATAAHGSAAAAAAAHSRRGAGGSSGVQAACRALTASAEMYGRSKEKVAHAKACDEAASLLSAQRELEQATGERLIGTSLAETVLSALRLGNMKVAKRLQGDFKMGDKHFTWLRVRALSEARDWEGMDRLSRERRGMPPGDVSLSVLVDACADAGAPDEARRFISRITDPDKAADAYERIGDARAAAEARAMPADSGGGSAFLDRFAAGMRAVRQGAQASR